MTKQHKKPYRFSGIVNTGMKRLPQISIVTLLAGLIIQSLSCQVAPTIAQAEAQMTIVGENINIQNAGANINFNEVFYEKADGRPVIQFSNSANYFIQFQLAGSSPQAATYNMSSGNSLSGSFVVPHNGSNYPVTFVSTGAGQLIISRINVSDGVITSMAANFELNVTSGSPEQSANGTIRGVINF